MFSNMKDIEHWEPIPETTLSDGDYLKLAHGRVEGVHDVLHLGNHELSLLVQHSQLLAVARSTQILKQRRKTI